MTGIGKYVKCKVCDMGSFGGIDWLNKHNADHPEPFDRDFARQLYLSARGGDMIVHPLTHARLVMSWRRGDLDGLTGEAGGS